MSTISSGTTLTTALVQVGDTTGNLVIKTGASNTTAMTISGTDQSVTFAGGLNLGAPIAIVSGGTGANTAATARTNLGLAIGTDVLAPTGTGTGLTALNGSNVTSGTVAVARGGTGTASPSLIGGTNITISGSWPNQTVTAAGGGVTSLNGQTGAITNTDLYAIGSCFFGYINSALSSVSAGTTYSASSIRNASILAGDPFGRNSMQTTSFTGEAPSSGTYRYMQTGSSDGAARYFYGVFMRVS